MPQLATTMEELDALHTKYWQDPVRQMLDNIVNRYFAVFSTTSYRINPIANEMESIISFTSERGEELYNKALKERQDYVDARYSQLFHKGDK